MARTASGSTAATSIASESKYDSITALCALDIPTVKIGSQEDPFVVINNIQPGASLTKLTGMTLKKFTQWDEVPSRHGRLFFYSAEHEVLIIQLPLSEIHEYLHRTLDKEITHQMSEDLYREISEYGSATYYMRKSGKVTAAGEGDSSLGLKDRRKNDRWPTVVIEAGWSQSRVSLVAKAHWWFEASNRAVKIALLIIASPLQIQVEKWKTNPLPHSSAAPGRPNTRLFQATNLYPKVHPPVLTVNRASANTPSNDYKVTSSPLRLEFRDVFLRNPVPPEGDLLLGESFFRSYAEEAWENVLDQ
ncbi:hypothetical protein V2G26_000284 [Clonostachys chloroleuca]